MRNLGDMDSGQPNQLTVLKNNKPDQRARFGWHSGVTVNNSCFVSSLRNTIKGMLSENKDTINFRLLSWAILSEVSAYSCQVPG